MKTILITGVNRGIGKELASVFLEKNWKVIGTVRRKDTSLDIDSHPLFEKKELDLSSFNSIHNFSKHISEFSIDVLLNNAGVMDSPSLDHNIYQDENKLMNVYMVNSIAPYLLAEKLIPQLQKGSEKLVVSISSLLSDPNHMLSQHWVYGSSKSALNYAMIAFSKNYTGIKSVLVRPGWVKTDMGGKKAPLDPHKVAQYIAENIEHHKEKLLHGTILGPDGDVMHIIN